MTRKWIAITGLLLLAGCSGGGGEDPAPAPPTGASTEFLVATSEGLWRGLTNGKGGVVFVHPNLQRADVLLGDGHVSYSRVQPIQPPGSVDNEDIWTVNTDGTGNRALVNTPMGEFLQAVKGPWVFYYANTSWSSVRVDTGQQAVLSTGDVNASLDQLVGTRAVFSHDSLITSINFDGTDKRTHADVSSNDRYLFIKAAIEQPATVLYEVVDNAPPQSQLFSVSLAEGAQEIPLTEVTKSTYAGHSGGRVVYRRCLSVENAPSTVQCNVLSVRLDGTQTAVLAAQSENEAVQGIIGERVVIRRNVNGNDQLVSVPITGGAESFIMLVGDTDFIEVVAGDALVLRRSTGTWRLDLNGTLTKLGPTPGGHAYQVVGTAVCYNVNAAYYCAPLDGSGPEVKITGNGKFVGVL